MPDCLDTMDHLSKPANALQTSIPVPLLPYIAYDFGGIGGFGSRKGYVKNGHLDPSRTSLELASLVQSWLYFGLLSELLGRSVGPNDLAATDAPSPADSDNLCTLRLPALLDEWQASLRGMGVWACDERLHVAWKTINTAIDLSGICDGSEPVESAQYASVMLSVKLLLVTVVHMYNAFAPNDIISFRDPRLFPLPLPYARTAAAAGLLQRYMVDAKLCPQAIDRICLSYNYLTALYLLQLPRHRVADHTGCSRSRCIAYNTKTAGYQSKHVNDDCHCSHLGVNQHLMEKIVTSGDIPLVMLEENISGRIKLHLTASKFAKPYVALSHVWRDGLGNPDSNSLPYCQIQRLYTTAKLRWFKRTDWLWIDTLCIPVAEESIALRQQAIASMATIYQGARSVLVMDAEIEDVKATESDADFLAYVLCSAWNSRCWTYQEAVLGKRLFFNTQEHRQELRVGETEMDKEGTPVESRWLVWRWLNAPMQSLAQGLASAHSVLPLTQLFTISFAIGCGPQAWCMIRDWYRSWRRGSGTSSPQDLLLGLLWLGGVMVFIPLTIPVSAFLLLALWISGFVFLVVLSCLWSTAGSSTLPSSEILCRQMRSQLAADLAAEICSPPTHAPADIHETTEIPKTGSKRFIRAWNALALRMTTQEEDLLFVLSCLTSMIPFRIVSLSKEARMRALVSSQQRLPIALLFDPQLAHAEYRDPENSWLPLVPRAYVLPTDPGEPCFLLSESHMIILPDELGSTYMVLTDSPEAEHTKGSEIASPRDQMLSFVADAAPLDSRLYFLVQASDPVNRPDGKQSIHAVKFQLIHHDGEDAHCSFEGPTELSPQQVNRMQPARHIASVRTSFCMLKQSQSQGLPSFC